MGMPDAFGGVRIRLHLGTRKIRFEEKNTMTIRHLKIFIRVAETGSMSLAAKTLYLSQPTVSQAVHELEEHYETRLFDRLSRRLFITEEGKKLLTLAHEAVQSFDKLEQSMQGFTRTERMRLGATITVGNCLLPSLLADFQNRRPRTEIFSRIENTYRVEEELLGSGLDVGIVEGQIKSPELVNIPVAEDYLVLACESSHPLAGKESFEPEDLEDADFVMREKGSGTRELFEQYLQEQRISVRCRVEAPFPEAMKHAVLYNHCLAVISVRLIEEEIKKGTIRAFRHPENAWDRTFNLVYHKDKPVSEPMLLLKELLKQYRKPPSVEAIYSKEMPYLAAFSRTSSGQSDT